MIGLAELSRLCRLRLLATLTAIFAACGAVQAQEYDVYCDRCDELNLPYSYGFCLIDKIRSAVGDEIRDIDIVIGDCDPAQDRNADRQGPGGKIVYLDKYRIVLDAEQVRCALAHGDMISWDEDDPFIGGRRYTLSLEQCADLMPRQ